MAAPIPPYNPFNDDDDSSAIMMALFQLGIKCRVPGEDEDGIGTSLLQAVGRMRKLFMKITETRDNTETISEINRELTGVLKLVVMHQKCKKTGTHHQGVGFIEIANALDQVEKTIRLNDDVGFTTLNKSSPLSAELKKPMSVLYATRLKLYEEFHPEEYRTNGKMSMNLSGTVLRTQKGNIMSRNDGPFRLILPEAQLISTEGSIGDGNYFEGGNSVYNGPRAQLGAKNGILCGNIGDAGRHDFVAAEMFTEDGTILCNNRNTRTDNVTVDLPLNAQMLDSVALGVLMGHNGQPSSAQLPTSRLPNSAPVFGVNATTQHAQPIAMNLKNGIKMIYNSNHAPGFRSGSPGTWNNGSNSRTAYGQQSNMNSSERDDESMS